MTLAVGGENLIDFLQEEGDRSPPAFVAHPGGSPMNVAMAASRQEMEVHYLTPVSSDSLGSLIAKRLQGDRVHLATPRKPEPTTLAVVALENGAATYQFYRSGTAERQINAEQLAAARPEGLKAFHIGSLAVTDGADAEAWEVFYGQCFDDGLMTSYDPNVRPTLTPDRDGFIARLERMAAKTRVFKLSDEDLHWLYPEMTESDAFQRLVGLSSASIVVLTRGPDGATGVSGDVHVTIPAAPVPSLVDTVGAGDTFMATLVRQAYDRRGDLRLSAEDLKGFLETASRAAAINCGRAGCQPPFLNEL